jgi:glycine/D-amino acid oxidase-like deaminating enzyme
MIKTDIAIIGGGITGLWLLNQLQAAGYSTLLFERTGLGQGQTLSSQGMIHGGLKYNLAGVSSNASETIAGMPGIWQQCLAGDGPVDLHNAKCLARCYHLFSDAALGGKLAAFLGSKAVRGGARALKHLPEPFNHPEFKGSVYEIPDMVIDTASVVAALAESAGSSIIQGAPTPVTEGGSGIVGLTLPDGRTVKAERYIFAAGAGNEDLLRQSDIAVGMQRRPLHQVLVRGPLPTLFGHAVSMGSGDKPRMTISTHKTKDLQPVWYLGGDLAETGIHRSNAAQIEFAKNELKRFLPFIDTSECEFKSWRIDRAEPKTPDTLRPDRPFCAVSGNVLVCWPIKLTLVPLLAREVMKHIIEPSKWPAPSNEYTVAKVGEAPWEQAF